MRTQLGWKVVGSNRGAGKDFSHEISEKEHLFQASLHFRHLRKVAREILFLKERIFNFRLNIALFSLKDMQ